ncbi:GbsR/MarR family transcriptional regulator [Flindersiella endophytica]
MARREGRPDEADVLEWVERIAKYVWDQDRMPMIAGRIFGWLMICDPPEQTAAQIAEAIGASRASLTNNLRLLGQIGFLTQRTRPGDRSVYYRADEAAFGRMIRQQIESMGELREILAGGADLAGPAERGRRLREATEVFGWLERVFADAPPMPRTTSEKGRAG